MSTRAPVRPAADALRTVVLERRRLAALWLAVFACLATVPGGYSRFVLAKLLVLCAAGLIAVVAPRAGRLPRELLVVSGIWGVLFVVAALAGDTPWASLVGRWPRYEGLPTLALYGSACWIGARVVGSGATRMIHLGHAVTAMSLVLCGFSLLSVAGASPLGASGVTRDGSLLGNATDQGAVAMMCAIVLAPRAFAHRSAVEIAGVGASLGTLAIAGSRTSLGLTVLALLVLVVAQRGSDLRAVAVPVAAALIALVAFVVAVPVTRARLLHVGTGRARLHQWDLTLELVNDHRLLGVGPSRYGDVFTRYEDRAFVRQSGPYTLFDSPHNVVLQVLGAGGVVLLLCTLVGLGLVVRAAVRGVRVHPERLAPAIAVAAYLLSLLLNFTVAGPACLAGLLLGVVVARPAVSEAPQVARLAIVSALTVAAVMLGSASVGEVFVRNGIQAAFSGDTATAVEKFDRARAVRPWDVDVDTLAGEALSRAAQYGYVDAAPAAESAALRSLDRAPDNHNSYISLAVALIAQGQPARAEGVLDLAIAAAPMRADSYIERAVARRDQGDGPGAWIDLVAALRLAPGNPVARSLFETIQPAIPRL